MNAKRLLLVSATQFELQPTIDFCNQHFTCLAPFQWQANDVQIQWLESGVGAAITSHVLTAFLSKQPPFTLVLNAGIAGAYTHQNLEIGQVCIVKTECFADLGAQTAQNNFIKLSDFWTPPHAIWPYQNDTLDLPTLPFKTFRDLPQVEALTVNTCSGEPTTIENLYKRYPNSGLESMEGAAVAYCCRQLNQAVTLLKSVSNYVEPRNKSHWQIPLAVKNLNDTIAQFLQEFINMESLT